MGQSREALAEFDTALRLKPGFEPAQSARAILVARTNPASKR
jgi:hypothetical protein